MKFFLYQPKKLNNKLNKKLINYIKLIFKYKNLIINFYFK